MAMAYDEGLAQVLRDDLADQVGIVEKKTFGGIAFMQWGNMLCGVHKDGGMFRVGKDNEAAALTIEGTGPIQFTGRKMGGMIDLSDEGMENDDARGQLVALAKQFISTLPAK
jgi:hypothetical protein